MPPRRIVKKSRTETLPAPGLEQVKDAAPWTDLGLSVGIFVLAFSVRLLYLFQIESVPLFYHLASDARVYDGWAQRIAAGDWLGHGVFYQAPLYPYFLGLLYSILGRDLWSIRIVQIVLGAATCGLLCWVGKLFFSRKVGVASGLLLALYGPAIFYDGLIQKAFLDLFLLTLLLLLLGRAQLKPHWGLWIAAGFVLGLLGLSRENALLWLLVLPAWIWFYFPGNRPQMRCAWVGLFLLGLTLVLFPVGLRNLKVGGEFALTTSQFGPNFFIGNNPDADGTYVPLRGGHGDPQFERQDATEIAEQSLDRTLSPGEVSRYWLQRSLDYIRSQPLEWLQLMARKWLIVWNVRELEDADDFYLYQRWSPLLWFLASINHFGLLAPLAAMGIVVTWRQWRRLWLLYILLGTLALSVALFYVFGRYRLPLAPFLALFSGAGIVEGFYLWRTQRIRLIAISTTAGLIALAMAHWPVVGRAEPSAAGYNNLGNALGKQGRMREAIESYQQALLIAPNDAVTHYNLANLLASQGRLEEAIHRYREAVEIHPDFAEAHNNLGNVLLRRDEVGAALQQFRKALEISPNQSEFHFNLATALARQESFAEAIDHIHQALKLQPDLAAAHHLLGIILAAQGHLDKAMDRFRLALRIRPDFAEAHESLAQALTQQGKKAEAIRHYEEALRIMKLRRETDRQR